MVFHFPERNALYPGIPDTRYTISASCIPRLVAKPGTGAVSGHTALAASAKLAGLAAGGAVQNAGDANISILGYTLLNLQIQIKILHFCVLLPAYILKLRAFVRKPYSKREKSRYYLFCPAFILYFFLTFAILAE